MTSINDNLYHLSEQIRALSGGRDVTLTCVSKTKSPDMIAEAYACGQRHFGESYPDEASVKIRELKTRGFDDIVWHFIGPLQRGKTRQIATDFDWVESLDRQVLATRLSEQRPAQLPPLNVLIQVNISGEAQKHGCAPEELDSLIACVQSCPALRLRGLMGIAKETASREEIFESFSRLQALFAARAAKFGLDTLSMGMSGDFAEALRAGATEVRIGSAIFGPREYAAPRLGFIGGGNMAWCIFRNVAQALPKSPVTVSGPHPDRLERFAAAHAAITSDNAACAAACDIIFLGVKPQILPAVLSELAASGTDFRGKLVVSMAAGFPLKRLTDALGSGRVIRIMPNTPAKIGMGVTAVTCGPDVTAADRRHVLALLGAMGRTAECDERALNVIGAVAGCGPAFVFRFMEALCAEAERHGLSPELARSVVEYTVAGAAQLSVNDKERESTLASMREAVTSKGGTTAAGLSRFTAHGFEQMMQDVIDASLKRTEELEKETADA